MSATNIITVIATVAIQTFTNTHYKYPMEYVPIACPDGMIGCLVAHGKLVPVPNPSVRTKVTERVEITKITCDKPVFPERVITNRITTLSEVEERLATAWEEKK